MNLFLTRLLFLSLVIFLAFHSSFANETVTLDPTLKQVILKRRSSEPTIEAASDKNSTRDPELLSQAKTQLKSNHYQDALPLFHRFRTENPERVDSWIYEIKTLKKLGKTSAANSLQDELLTQKPELKNSPLLKNL